MYLDDVARSLAEELGWNWTNLEEEQRQLLRGYAVLVRAKGVHVTAEDVHDAWVAWMAGRDPTHGHLKPFADLSEATQRADEPFSQAVQAVASRLPNPRRE